MQAIPLCNELESANSVALIFCGTQIIVSVWSKKETVFFGSFKLKKNFYSQQVKTVFSYPSSCKKSVKCFLIFLAYFKGYTFATMQERSFLKHNIGSGSVAMGTVEPNNVVVMLCSGYLKYVKRSFGENCVLTILPRGGGLPINVDGGARPIP